MEFHVDYWNYIGWKDPYSSSEYTLRQQEYVRHFGLGSSYTPQAVVNGKNELVGSNSAKLRQAINTGMQQKTLTTINIQAKAGGNHVSVTYTIAGGKGQLLHIALVQKDAETNVKRGENEGRKLKHINIVRSLKTITAQDAGSVTIELPSGLAAAYAIIAYTQQQDSFEITGAAQTVINE